MPNDWVHIWIPLAVKTALMQRYHTEQAASPGRSFREWLAIYLAQELGIEEKR